jgi:hypothetical protein
MLAANTSPGSNPMILQEAGMFFNNCKFPMADVRQSLQPKPSTPRPTNVNCNQSKVLQLMANDANDAEKVHPKRLVESCSRDFPRSVGVFHHVYPTHFTCSVVSRHASSLMQQIKRHPYTVACFARNVTRYVTMKGLSSVVHDMPSELLVPAYVINLQLNIVDEREAQCNDCQCENRSVVSPMRLQAQLQLSL